MLSSILKVLLYALCAYIGVAFLASAVSVDQESKIWRDLNPLSPFGMVKVYLLNVCWMVFCLFGSIGAVVYHVVTLDAFKPDASERLQRLAHCVVERQVAMALVVCLLGPVEIRGLDNLPSDSPGSPAPVYIANHASQIDTAVVYFLKRRFRWISKSSVLYLPGVGQIMWLSGHVFIDRFSKSKPKTEKNDGEKKPKENDKPAGVKTSARNLYMQSNKSIQEGVPMFFFPQGTRRMVDRLPFKDGAFKVALPNSSVLVPISIDIAVDCWNSLHPLFSSFPSSRPPAILTVHKPIPVTPDTDLEKVKKQCYETIYSVLPDYRTKAE